jgi:hydroxyacylglutathione hydrolase
LIASYMEQKIKLITLPLPFRMGMVNCYLLQTAIGHILIDTGSSSARNQLRAELESNSCTPGSLKLIVLTHGDFDHTGNAASLRSLYGAEIAMHSDDSGMVERGDMFDNRKKPNSIIKLVLPVFTGFGKSERFTPDILIGEDYEFSEYALDAKAISLPGHSRGSIGILSGRGELFCGDLFENIKGPALNSLMDDPDAARVSIRKLEDMKIKSIYPGHGQPFAWEAWKSMNER